MKGSHARAICVQYHTAPRSGQIVSGYGGMLILDDVRWRLPDERM